MCVFLARHSTTLRTCARPGSQRPLVCGGDAAVLRRQQPRGADVRAPRVAERDNGSLSTYSNSSRRTHLRACCSESAAAVVGEYAAPARAKNREGRAVSACWTARGGKEHEHRAVSSAAPTVQAPQRGPQQGAAHGGARRSLRSGHGCSARGWSPLYTTRASLLADQRVSQANVRAGRERAPPQKQRRRRLLITLVLAAACARRPAAALIAARQESRASKPRTPLSTALDSKAARPPLLSTQKHTAPTAPRLLLLCARGVLWRLEARRRVEQV